MIDFDVLEGEVKKGKIDNSYIFCGLDEELIKEGISLIVNNTVDKSLLDLNYIRLDGLTTTFDEIMNACETMPFMGEKKVVVVYRASFLKEKTDATGTKVYNDILKYLKDLPPYTVLIMYYLFNDKRDTPKKSNKVKSLDKVSKVVYFDKLKKDRYYKKVEEVFKEKGKEIGKVELRYFAEKVQNNFDIIRREADKLISYAQNRTISKIDIDKLIANSSEDDIFDLIDFISQKKVEKTLDLLYDLLSKSDQHMLIISNIENNFKRLYEIKVLVQNGSGVNDISSRLKLPTFVCEKLINQSSKFSIKQLQKIMEICLETENKMKTTGVDKNMEMELMIFNIFMTK
ncbi:DNA polymerase III subunit delta [Clostridium sp. AL.422]|uniref:DNA polymerase III subunit delta n=1 Tax=Clostridium TaxID=1485 RepID=UPI00293DF135|nr:MULTISPECIES: DNA polymerase III subunit delta [unclassified Clostridium]MDV4150088.1 DNA polymerase III subunit delta [Clostridium sp. AL.422]